MAAQLVKNAKEYIGTNAEWLAMPTTGVTPGSTFYETDAKVIYIYSSGAWVLM